MHIPSLQRNILLIFDTKPFLLFPDKSHLLSMFYRFYILILHFLILCILLQLEQSLIQFPVMTVNNDMMFLPVFKRKKYHMHGPNFFLFSTYFFPFQIKTFANAVIIKQKEKDSRKCCILSNP